MRTRETPDRRPRPPSAWPPAPCFRGVAVAPAAPSRILALPFRRRLLRHPDGSRFSLSKGLPGSPPSGSFTRRLERGSLSPWACTSPHRRNALVCDSVVCVRPSRSYSVCGLPDLDLSPVKPLAPWFRDARLPVSSLLRATPVRLLVVSSVGRGHRFTSALLPDHRLGVW